MRSILPSLDAGFTTECAVGSLPVPGCKTNYEFLCIRRRYKSTSISHYEVKDILYEIRSSSDFMFALTY